MATPYLTPVDFRALTRLRQGRLGIAEGAGDALLQAELDRAAAYVEIVTGQHATDKDLVPVQPYLADTSLSNGVIATLIGQTIQMRAEQNTFQSQEGYVDDASDDVVSSLSVGSFSQTKTDPTRRGEQRALNSWPALASLLWMLMTPDRYSYWVVAIYGPSGQAAGMLPPSWSYENMLWPGVEGIFGFGYGFPLPAAAWDGSFDGRLSGMGDFVVGDEGDW